jgi:uncharacterized membrane protein
MDLRNAKTIGGIGTILLCLSFIPAIGVLFAIPGVILVLVSLNEIARKLNESRIFNNYLISVILNAISVLVAVTGLVYTAFLFMSSVIKLPFEEFSNVSPEVLFNRIFSQGELLSIMESFGKWLWIVLLVLVIIYALMVVSGYFIKESLNEVGEKLNDSNFKTAGLLIFLGNLLSILFGLGFIIVLVGDIFLAIAFFSIKVEAAETKFKEGLK